MRRTLNLILVITIGILLFPLNTLALKQDVGVKVKGDISISAVTTISSDVTIDVENRTTSNAYIELQNKSTIPLNVKVTDIEALSEGAPSTFVKDEEAWNLMNAGIEDTKNKIGFSINNGSYPAQYIMPDTKLDLNVVSAKGVYEGLGDSGFIPETLDNNETISYIPYGPYYDEYIRGNQINSETYTPGNEIYELNIDNGYAWTEGDLNFYYGITMVVGASNEGYDRNPVPELGIDGINVALLKGSNGRESYIEIYFDDLTAKTGYAVLTPNNMTYTTIDGQSGSTSAEFIGTKIRKEMIWDYNTQSMVEVENGEVYGTSYFYKITSSEVNSLLQFSQKPVYINLRSAIFVMERAGYSSIPYSISDILTNKSLF